MVKDLDAIVGSVANQQPTAGIQRDGVGVVELAMPRSGLAPRLNEFSVPGKLLNAVVSLRSAGMSFGYENVTVGSHYHIGWFIEQSWLSARNTGFAERHQNLSIRAELEHLGSFSVFELGIGHPQIPLRVQSGTMRKHEHPFAPAFEKSSGLIELQDRRLTSSGARVCITSMNDVDTAVVRNLDRSNRRPRDAAWGVSPIPDSAVWLRQVIKRFNVGLRVQTCCKDHNKRCDHEYESCPACPQHHGSSLHANLILFYRCLPIAR